MPDHVGPERRKKKRTEREQVIDRLMATTERLERVVSALETHVTPRPIGKQSSL